MNGRSFTYRCAGTGSPTIVFESGHGDGFEVWANVFDEISAQTRACVYDRPGLGGTGGSDPRLAPTFSPQDVATDLHALLSEAGIEPPYVLVGHSIAGIFLPVFAATYPRDVVGMVLLDPSTVWQFEGRQYAELLSESGGPLSEGGARLDVRAVRAQLQDATRITEPLVVLTAGEWLSSPRWIDRAWVADHDRLVREANADAIHIVVPGVGHYIQSEGSPTVLATVVLAVAEASSSGSLPRCSDLVRDSTWECGT